MVPWLEKFLEKRKQSQTDFFKAYTKLDIGSSKRCWDMFIKISWPLENFDLRLLQSLTLYGSDTEIEQFAGESFLNLVKLSFIRILFEKTITFTNVPSLKSLVIDQCTALNNGSSLPLVFPDNFQLQSLTYWSTYNGNLQLLTHFLAQIRGLKSLTIGIQFHLTNMDQAITEFINTVIVHKDTLRLFKIYVPLKYYQSTVDALKCDTFFVDAIQISYDLF